MKYVEDYDWCEKIEKIRSEITDIMVRKVILKEGQLYILYNRQLSDKDSIAHNIIRPVLKLQKIPEDVETIAFSLIYVEEALVDCDESNIGKYLLDGYSIIITSNSKQYIAANTFKLEGRAVSRPVIQNSLRGSQDSFVENTDTNLSLIRYRIKDKSLQIERLTVGRRTKTGIAVVYINDIANPELVNKVKKKIKAINIDGIINSGQLQKALSDKPFNIFPQAGIAEKPEMVCADILEGRIALFHEGSNLALVLPRTFVEFFDSEDDHFENMYIGILNKSLRFISVFITLTASALYISLLSYHPDILPAEYILSVISTRSNVPFNAATEALLLEIVSEILREASIRLPKQIGPAIGIVGTIVIGQAAVAAGLVGPLIVIIISLSTMASFISPDYSIFNTIRALKYFVILGAILSGLYGIFFAMTIILMNILSISSEGVPYSAPVSPFNFNDFKNYLLSNIFITPKRPNALKDTDKDRQ